MRTMPPPLRCLPAGLLAAGLVLTPIATPAAQEAEPARQEQAASGGAIALPDAARIALSRNPTIQLARENTLASEGLLRQNTGPFDLGLGMIFSAEYNRIHLTQAQLDAEKQKRDLFRILAENLQSVADDLERQLNESEEGFVFADCGRGFDLTIGNRPICISARQQANMELFLSLAEASGAEDIAAALVEANRREAANIVDILNITAYTQRENLRKMGMIPTLNDTLTVSLDLRLAKLFRNGMLLQPTVMLTSVQDNYHGKPRSPSYGGKGIPDTVRSVLGLTLDIPLGKGRGTVSTGAPERAAQASARAALESEAHTIAAQVQAVALAYWSLAAAQERLHLLEASEALEQRLLEMAKSLVAADELPRADLDFVRARLERTRGSVAAARQGVISARVSLADAMGVEVSDIEQAPLAADALPMLPPDFEIPAWDPGELGRMALERRYDLAAAADRLEASRILSEAARFDLKRRVDLQLGFAYAGLEEGGDITQATDFFKGWGNAITDFAAGPSFRVVLDFELPFANRVAQGRFMQARSLEEQGRIQRRDLERTILNTVEDLAVSLQKAMAEVLKRARGLERQNAALDAEIQRFEAGESTAIDLILTQEQQVQQEILLVGARQNMASLLTRLRFETGTLVDLRIDEGHVIVEGLHLSDLDVAGGVTS